MSETYELLEEWLTSVLLNNKEIITESKEAVDVYAALYPIWLEDCQKQMKKMALEAMNTE